MWAVPPVVHRACEHILRAVPACGHAQQLAVEDHARSALLGEHDGVGLVADVDAIFLVRAWILRLANRDAGRDHRAVVHVEPGLLLALDGVVEAGGRERASLFDPGPEDADLRVGQLCARRRHQQVLLQTRDQVDQATVLAVATVDGRLARVATADGRLPAPEAVAVHHDIVPMAHVAVLDEDRIHVGHEVDLAFDRRRKARGFSCKAGQSHGACHDGEEYKS